MVEQSIVQRRDPQIRRAPNSAGLYDVLDLILDKGIVVDAFVRVSLVGIELLTIDLRVVVASVDTYLRYAEGVERLQLYDRSGAKRLPDLVGKSMKGKAIGQSVNKVTDAIAGNDDDQGDEDPEEHAESHEGGFARTLARGVRKTVGRVVDTITGSGDDDDDDSGDADDAQASRHGRSAGKERESHRGSGNGSARRAKSSSQN